MAMKTYGTTPYCSRCEGDWSPGVYRSDWEPAGIIVGRRQRPVLAGVLSCLIAAATFDLALLMSSHGGRGLSS